ncbi:MAG: NAD(P)H-dependent oxidoreductase [Candidatus Thorarchaeota archaeon]|nr:NAD(P)H-dependent oxidoreductase [Candidatus Thorarchaeota archaeon]
MKRALLVVGSPRSERSSSNSILDYLGTRLVEHGVTIEKTYLYRLQDEHGLESLLASVDASDIVVLGAPLYVDSLPAPVISALQFIASHRTQESRSTRPMFGVVMNSGFPEAFQSDCAIENCRLFAQRASLQWAGGIAFGGGAAIAGRPLQETGGITRFLRPALDMAAAALAKGDPIPDSAIRLAARPMLPTSIYLTMATRTWKRIAKHHGAHNKLGAMPFARE